MVVGRLEGRPISVIAEDATYSLLALGPFVGALPRGISADGRIVVGETYNDPNDTPQNAAVWRDGRLRILGLESGGYRARADAVSADGRVAVGYANSATHGLQAARWVNGQVENLGDIGGGSLGSEARATNADGSVVVGTAMAFTRAFRWEDGLMQALPLIHPDIVRDSDAFDVSGDGARIVGFEQHQDFSGEAILWTDGVAKALGTLGGAYAVATSISDDGALVFGYSGTGSGNAAFIWDALNGMRRLSDVLVQNGVNLQGWQRLSEIRDVSADGHTILGYGYNERGFYSPFIATIPEPAMIALVLVGLAACTARRR